MEVTYDSDLFQTNCRICQKNGPLTLHDFNLTSHEGSCSRQVRIREEGRLNTVHRSIFQIVSEDGCIHANLFEPDKDGLGLILNSLKGPFLSRESSKALKRAIRNLPEKCLHEFLGSRHEERVSLFALLDESEIDRLQDYHIQNIKNRITVSETCDHATIERYSHQIHRFALFVFYFQNNLKKLKKGRYYFDQEAPSPIDIFRRSTGDLAIVHHLKDCHQIKGKTRYFGTIPLGSGSENLVRLSLRVNLETKKMDFCATATPNFQSLKKHVAYGEELPREFWLARMAENVARWKILNVLTPHIVMPYYSSRYINKYGECKFNVVMEFGEENLESRILEGRCTVKDYLGLLEGLYILHERGYYSFDIKFENVLGVGGQLKYIDVGSAIAKGEDDGSHILTNSSRAPELLDESASVTQATDVFALGIAMYMMKYRREPSFCPVFGLDESRKEMMQAFDQFHGSFHPKKKDAIGCVIKKMLHGDPRKRITANKAWRILSESENQKRPPKKRKTPL